MRIANHQRMRKRFRNWRTSEKRAKLNESGQNGHTAGAKVEGSQGVSKSRHEMTAEGHAG